MEMGMAEKDEGKAEEGQEEAAVLAPFDATKKKKKKRVSIQEALDGSMGIDSLLEKIAGLSDNIEEDEEGEGTDRDYLYEELLGVFNILRSTGQRSRIVIRPCQVLREGTKKTVFVNFMDQCTRMHRQPEHVMNFFLAELGTSGSLDGQQRLVVQGRFGPTNFDGILRRYLDEYVICNSCKCPDTILSKENRLVFLRCEECGSGQSVAPIKAGFVARVGRRRAGI